MNWRGSEVEAGITAPSCVLKASICLHLETILATFYNQQHLKTEF